MVEDAVPEDDKLLAALDRQNRTRLAEQLRRRPAAAGDQVMASALAGVLFDVLTEATKPDTEAAKQLAETWERLEGDDRVITRRTFDFEAFMVGAFGTVVAIDLALEGEARDEVRNSFLKEPGTIVHRFRRAVPGPARFRWYMQYYGEALGPERHPDRTWYVPVGRAFSHACREQTADPDAFAENEAQVAAAGLELFLRAASGTVEAVRGWTIV